MQPSRATAHVQKSSKNISTTNKQTAIANNNTIIFVI